MIRNLPTDAGDVRDAVSIYGLGRSPGVGNGTPPIPVLLPGKFHGLKILAGCKESDMTEYLSSSSSLSTDPAHTSGWFHFRKNFQGIFKGTTGFPSLAPSPPAARLLLESTIYGFSSLNFWVVKHPPLSSAWFPILNLLLRKGVTFSVNRRQELLTSSR